VYRLLLAFVCVGFLVGCKIHPRIEFHRPPYAGEDWDTTYLLDVDPSKVSIAALASHATLLDDHYWKYAQHNGICWPPWRSSEDRELPDRFVNGGDSGIFTGYALATYVFKYRYTNSDRDLAKVIETVRGLHLLTHGTGTPGVICRCAFPADLPSLWNYPAEWGHRIERGFVDTSRVDIKDPVRGVTYPPMIYYTRATKDQLTGICFGLAAAWHFLSDCASEHQVETQRMQLIVADIVEDLYNHLEKHDWKIRDEKGENDTSADSVGGLLKAQFLALYRHTVSITNPGRAAKIQRLYVEEFDDFIDLSNTLAYADRFNNLSQYYGHNLRTARSFTIWLLEEDSIRQSEIAGYFSKNIWLFVKDHQSAWFSFVKNVMTPADEDEIQDGLLSLKSLSLKPIRLRSSPLHDQEWKPPLIAVAMNQTATYVVEPHLRKPTSYFTWQKEPWDVGEGLDKLALGDTTGLDFLLPYYLGKSFNLFD